MSARTIIALVVAACLAGPSAASAATRTVLVGPPHRNNQVPGAPADGDLNAFFPSRLTIHAGDRVRFVFEGFHTVTLPAKGQPDPALVQPDASRPVSGVNDAAGAPFWFNGRPTPLLNPQVGLPAGGHVYDGSQLVGSGLPQEEGQVPPYVLRFPKTGTFKVDCGIHPGMDATIHVVPRGRRIPSARADAGLAARQIRRGVATLNALNRRAKAAPGTVDLGFDAGRAILYRFVTPAQVTAGTTVTFQMARPTTEVHTASFGPTSVLNQLANDFVAPLPGTGQTGPPVLAFNPQAFYASDPAQPVVYDGTNHGDGFANTGLLSSNRAFPLPSSFKVTFTKPGSYPFICLVHPFMKGTIKVV